MYHFIEPFTKATSEESPKEPLKNRVFVIPL